MGLRVFCIIIQIFRKWISIHKTFLYRRNGNNRRWVEVIDPLKNWEEVNNMFLLFDIINYTQGPKKQFFT
jgi:hypothetical protein